jgi:hypothetical protein
MHSKSIMTQHQALQNPLIKFCKVTNITEGFNQIMNAGLGFG